MTTAGFLEDARLEFQRLRRTAEQALDQVDDEDFFRSPGTDLNSLGVLVKHMAGNMRSRWRDFTTTDGEKSDRHRDEEFSIGEADSQASLMAAWETGWGMIFSGLDDSEAVGLEHRVTIRGEPFTVRQAIIRQLSHAAYHVGQIVYVAHRWRGQGWSYLTIPPGESRQFNETPQPYRA